MTISIQLRATEVSCFMIINSPKASARVVSRSRSPVFNTWSTTHCRKNGWTTVRTSSASASSSTCENAPPRPETLPVSSRSRTRLLSRASWKSGVGQSSSATPVNDADSSPMEHLRVPDAGSISVAERPLMAVSTTK